MLSLLHQHPMIQCNRSSYPPSCGKHAIPKVPRQHNPRVSYVIPPLGIGTGVRPVDIKTNAIPSEFVMLNDMVSDNSWTLVSHAVVNFSLIYFTLNWFYYFNLRRQIEKETKDKHNKKK